MPQYRGKLGCEVSVEVGYFAARVAMINSPGTNISDLKRGKSYIKLLVMVTCIADFVQ
ncbi:hypothetical protein [uncultured Bradyrhizobium sp.]|uniref:hypothetical protein n=1 Tax=Bradyrhizobium sp. TaxID=376 RepID=UPI002628B2B8|nr:hypothetical protein [uncultured Bradyrhizobium sp.]